MNHLFLSFRSLLLGSLLVSLAGCTSSGEAPVSGVAATSNRASSSSSAAGGRVKTEARASDSLRLGLSPLLASALRSPTFPATSPRQFEQLRQAQENAVRWAHLVSRSVAPPVESGPGVVVCELITQGTKPDLAAFGGGCTRWLHLAVAGQGEMGKTPLWGAVDEARREIGHTDLRLPKEEVALVARKLGSTHVVTATIKEQGATCTLALQSWNMPSLRPVGGRVVATGTREAVLSQLPVAARQLCARLGVRSPSVPTLAGVQPDDFEFLGRVP